MIIKATGKRSGRKITVEYNDGVFLFNHKKDLAYENIVRYEISRRHQFAGTYFPEEKSDLNIYNVINNYFFDGKVDIKVENADIGELENVAGRVY